MKIGQNKSFSNKLLKRLTKENLISRSVRCVYLVDNFIIKTSSDATCSRLPLGADQCLNEFNIFHSNDERLKVFKDILCPVYAIYESRYIYITVHKRLTALCTNSNSNETIYSYLKKGLRFRNEDTFFYTLEKFKKLWVTDSVELQNEYCKLSTFGYDENRNLLLLDYGML
ncbi:hypothetical protein HBE96_24450 [Clostridium sp. P21]|uniref:Uncharacterized protein n=2 Tax=Clostridium muellerianum TaxID=2716538 RepID=A0A7Y0ELM2_9CLOT|nr:hypothetical protein [Clostridium muellerianum]